MRRYVPLSPLILLLATTGTGEPRGSETHDHASVNPVATASERATIPSLLAAAPVEATIEDPAGGTGTTPFSGLETSDSLILDHPRGGRYEWRVAAVRDADGCRALTLSDGAQISTVTVRGDRFYGTLATDGTVYQVRGRGMRVVWTDQQALTARRNPLPRDFRHAPG